VLDLDQGHDGRVGLCWSLYPDSVEFPPRRKPGSFNLQGVLDKLSPPPEGVNLAWKAADDHY
jgi:hypothetical protein